MRFTAIAFVLAAVGFVAANPLVPRKPGDPMTNHVHLNLDHKPSVYLPFFTRVLGKGKGELCCGSVGKATCMVADFCIN
ncbi:hypothetical protein PM082_018040 [Marasmius tenuissimus]|nr:hypothetical protein PM082_018040 [Marasmius tenuissimus]